MILGFKGLIRRSFLDHHPSAWKTNSPQRCLGFQFGFYEEHYARIAFKWMNLFLLNDKCISFLRHLSSNCLTIYIPFTTDGGNCGEVGGGHDK